MHIMLIRHGSTAGNLEHRYVGSTDESLTEETLSKLNTKRNTLGMPDLVFVSPMKRCLQTAEGLFPGCTMELVPDLKECDFGEFEYKNYLELQDDDRYQAWIDSNGMMPFPGGESREQFIKRCSTAFAEACSRARAVNCEKIAFVVHGGTIMAILDQYAVPHRDYFEWQVKNLEGFTGVLQETDGKVRITEIEGKK